MEKDLEILKEVHTFDNQIKNLEINSENGENIGIFQKYFENILTKLSKNIDEMTKELEKEISKI